MTDELSDEERDLIAKHRASSKRRPVVRISGKHEKTGADFEFEVDDERADRIVSKYNLWDDDEDDETEDEAPKGKTKADPKVVPAHFGRTRRSS